MSSPYDAGLLASAPEATKAQLQAGYNPDLLVEKTSSTPTTPLVSDPEVASRPLTAAQRSREFESVPATKTKTPFYATKKGIIIIVVVVIVIIAVVVGGAVGGTRKKKSLNSSSLNSTSSNSPISSSTHGSVGSTSSSTGGTQQSGVPASASANQGTGSTSTSGEFSLGPSQT